LHVLKRWAVWPRGIRWLAGIAVVVLAVAVVWLLFVPAADWLAHHDVGSVTGSLHETALDNARGRLLTLGAGLFAAGALIFTARNFTLSREGQVTDRYAKAIEQLGSDKLDVRIGGIYALERIARDSARDHPTVMEVLTAFIREHSHEQVMPSDPGGRERPPLTRPDVQAAVTVVGRRISRNDRERIDLIYARLTGARLTGANLTDANLFGVRLAGANLTSANLTGANLTSTDLTGALLTSTDLTRARLYGANLTSARFDGAILDGAILDGAILDGANLDDADLTSANLDGANLAGANLTGARWPGNMPVPEGWELDTSSGRLVAAGTD
jgi:uncharacterized protein YjbI with pentapeptide repeats